MLDLPDATLDTAIALRPIPGRVRSLHLALIEAGDELSSTLEDQLVSLGYSCVRTSTDRAVDFVTEQQVDAVLLSLDGAPEPMKLVSDLRVVTRAPLIVVHAPGGHGQAIAAMERGADDYVCADLDSGRTVLREIAIRVQTAVRAANRTPDGGGGELTFGSVRVDLGTLEAFVAGERVELTRTEFRLLVRMMRSPGSVIPSEDLLRAVWGHPTTKRENHLRVYVHRLRRRLAWGGQDGARIETLRGVGYRLVGWADPEEGNAAAPNPQSETH